MSILEEKTQRQALVSAHSTWKKVCVCVWWWWWWGGHRWWRQLEGVAGWSSFFLFFPAHLQHKEHIWQPTNQPPGVICHGGVWGDGVESGGTRMESERGRREKKKKVEMGRGWGAWRERQKKWQGKRLTHTAPVATLLPAATGSSSIKWQDIFHRSIISTEVTAKPNHHRYHQQGSSTHDWIALNEQKDIFLRCQPFLNHICQLLLQYNLNTYKKKNNQNRYFSSLTGSRHINISLLRGCLTRNSCFCKAVLCCYYLALQAITDHKNSSNINILLIVRPPAECQRSSTVLRYPDSSHAAIRARQQADLR